MDKHPAHRTCMSLYEHEYTNNNKFTHCYFYIGLIVCTQIKPQYKNLVCCQDK